MDQLTQVASIVSPNLARSRASSVGWLTLKSRTQRTEREYHFRLPDRSHMALNFRRDDSIFATGLLLTWQRSKN